MNRQNTFMQQETKELITLSDAAATQIIELIDVRDKPCLGIRIGVKSGGCSGLSYTFEYAEEKKDTDSEIQDKGVTIFIDKKAVFYLIGTQLDFVDEEVKSGFIFVNPNAKSSCGCGKSFN